MNDSNWLLLIIGAGLGFASKAALQLMAQKHERNQNTDTGRENVKQIMSMMLRHKSYTDRSYTAIRKAIGGYEDDEIRKMLHEVGARQTNIKGVEWWYLIDRSMERIERRNNAKK